MTGQAAFVTGDWGTSHLRLNLCDLQGNVLESKKGPGVGTVKDDVPGAFFALLQSWERHGALPAILCGMVGSTIGWRQAAYLPCPLRPEDIAGGMTRFRTEGRTILIAPGLSCTNRLKAPDLMRGEETQILGALSLEPRLRQGRHLLCMPGTHTKWVQMKDGVIENFLTAVSGELYDILFRHSILAAGGARMVQPGSAAFARALEKTGHRPDTELLHLLFGVRSGQLKGEIKTSESGDYLSGLIIGQDVRGAMRLFRQADAVAVIGAPHLSALYVQALAAQNIGARLIEGDAASMAGLQALYEITQSKRTWN